MREFSGDKHFGATVAEGFREFSSTSDLPSPAKMEERRDRVARRGYDIQKIERLPGNVGYIELRAFGAPEFVGQASTSAMQLMTGTDALILDLRRNGGGSPVTVAYLMSHFFPLGDERHLMDMYNRPDNTTQQYWTVATVAQRYDKPVYVLTSARTFSAGEDFAYGMQVQKRGTVIGETTGGGSNPVSWYSVGNDIAVAIPSSRMINFLTQTNWEHVGVKPDVAVPAAQALQTAHAAILRNLVASAKDDSERTELQRLLTMVEKGETEKPVYTLRGSVRRSRAHAACACATRRVRTLGRVVLGVRTVWRSREYVGRVNPASNGHRSISQCTTVKFHSPFDSLRRNCIQNPTLLVNIHDFQMCLIQGGRGVQICLCCRRSLLGMRRPRCLPPFLKLMCQRK